MRQGIGLRMSHESRSRLFFARAGERSWGTKIRHLADLARAGGWTVESLDYQGMQDPLERVTKLTDYCNAHAQPPVLVGSSMGGFVALATASRVEVRGLFLLAPALYLPGYQEHLPDPLPDCPTRHRARMGR